MSEHSIYSDALKRNGAFPRGAWNVTEMCSNTKLLILLSLLLIEDSDGAVVGLQSAIFACASYEMARSYNLF